MGRRFSTLTPAPAADQSSLSSGLALTHASTPAGQPSPLPLTTRRHRDHVLDSEVDTEDESLELELFKRPDWNGTEKLPELEEEQSTKKTRQSKPRNQKKKNGHGYAMMVRPETRRSPAARATGKADTLARSLTPSSSNWRRIQTGQTFLRILKTYSTDPPKSKKKHLGHTPLSVRRPKTIAAAPPLEASAHSAKARTSKDKVISSAHSSTISPGENQSLSRILVFDLGLQSTSGGFLRPYHPGLLPWHFVGSDQAHTFSSNAPHAKGRIPGSCMPFTPPNGSRWRTGIRFACDGQCLTGDACHVDKIELTWLVLLGTGHMTTIDEWASLVHSGADVLSATEAREVSHLCGLGFCREPSHLVMEDHQSNSC
ncbi:hypothetical protein CC80DRAFT_540144 [Byssothecium circinans]|uniref:Zinc-binding loop region of homing endonuclease domain-containing protein n=1 Tax=Byssothecium circinans TaxID=147558 RepID=A0A6A5TA48_9PLEO|nr:hypothetical protein CC80DRAFT_540144 [Byssothecium circinans]